MYSLKFVYIIEDLSFPISQEEKREKIERILKLGNEGKRMLWCPMVMEI